MGQEDLRKNIAQFFGEKKKKDSSNSLPFGWMGSAFCRSSNRAPPVHWFAYCSSTLSACWLSICLKGGPGEKNVGCGGGMGASGGCWGVCAGGKGACGGGTGACVGMADLKSS